MSFPIINFKTTNTEVAPDLKELAQQKLSSLEKFTGDVPMICDVEFEKVTDQNSGNIYRVEVNLTVDGKLYRAESTRDSFEKGIDGVRDELDKEIRRASSKQETLLKRGGRKIKDMLRFGA